VSSGKPLYRPSTYAKTPAKGELCLIPAAGFGGDLESHGFIYRSPSYVVPPQWNPWWSP